MKTSYRWLVELTGVDWPVEMMAERLTACGTACEYIEPTARFMDKVVVGQVTALNPVPGASKIQLATVNLGSHSMDVVCGAPNVAVGQKVPVALEGARLNGDIVIKKTRIRGVESSAMICSERELGISDDHSGILVLEDLAVIGAPLKDCLDYDDFVMTFELTPNRPDCLGVHGIARDLAALAGKKLTKAIVAVGESGHKADEVVKVTINDPDACPRYAARVIRNIKIAPSPWWMRKRLIMAGVRPISNVVDITNYVMLETGHPLHAFDLDRFGSSEVVVRRAANNEKFTTLDGKSHDLTPDVLLITNGRAGVAAGGVMGGLDSEVEATTKNILLEAAYFSPSVIRKSRKQLGLTSESSSRFERGVDPNGVEYAINRAAALMQELCGGEVLGGIVDCYPKRIDPKRIKLRVERCNKILGTDYSAGQIRTILASLEFTVGDGSPMEVTVPTFRPDIEREIDLIEEVVRMMGYDSVPDAITNIGPLYTPVQYEDCFRNEARRILTACGFDEMIQHGLADARLASLLYPDRPQIRIANPVSEELNIMRNSLAQTTLNIVSHNVAHRNIDLCLFELGKTYLPPVGGNDWTEELCLSLAVTGETEHTWRDRPRSYDFYDLAGVIQRLAEHFGWAAVTYEPMAVSFFDPDLSFKILVGGVHVGIIGRVQSGVARKFDIKPTVHLAELALAPLIAASGARKEYRALPVYPSAPRDLAVVVGEEIKAGDLVAAVKKAGGKIAETVQIFDLYTGKQIETNKKSIAIAITFRSPEGNLSSEQVDEAQANIVDVLKKEFNAQIRDK